jgi:hypothetical protein
VVFIIAWASIVVALVVFAASGGVRGSDQYWYVTDVERLVTGSGPTTTSVFPVGLLGSESALPPPFIHNVLSVYMAAVPATVLGPFEGWIALNVASILATAGFIYLAAREAAPAWAAGLAALLYPLLPVTVWHAAQPLTEASIAVFAACTMFLVARAGSSFVGWLAVTASLGLLYLSRHSYLPLLLIVPFALLAARGIRASGNWRVALAAAAGLAVAAAIPILVREWLFGSESVQQSYGRLLHTAVPGQTDNMWFNFDLSPANIADALPLRAELILAKLQHVNEQFLVFPSVPLAVFYWTFNVLAILALIMLWRTRRDPQRRTIVAAALAPVAVHFATILLFQNQVRYTLAALPGLLVVLAIAIGSVSVPSRLQRQSVALAGAIAVTLAATVPAVVIGRTIRAEALAESVIQREADAMIDRHLDPDHCLILVNAETPQLFAYAARPRLVLHVLEDYSATELDRLRAVFPTQWLLAPLDSEAPSRLEAPNAPVARLTTTDNEWGLWALPPAGASAAGPCRRT